MTSLLEAIDKIYYLIYAINILTLIGSMLSFIVFSRRVFKKSSIGVYCKCLAISDLFVLVNLCLGIATSILNYPLINYNDAVCKLIVFISGGFSPIPGWILVVFSIDQLITVSRRSQTSRFFNKSWFQYTLIAGIFVFNCVLYSPSLVLNGILNVTINENISYVGCESVSIVMPIVYLTEACFIPIGILLLTTSLTIRVMVKSRNRTLLVSLSSSKSSISQTNVRHRKVRELKYAFNSIILNIVFVLCSTPLVVYYILPKTDYLASYVFSTFGFLFFYLNFSLHFWIHLTVNPVFKKELISVCV